MVYVFGKADLDVYASDQAATSALEAVDVADGLDDFFGPDGPVVVADLSLPIESYRGRVVPGGDITLRNTAENDGAGLKRWLKAALYARGRDDIAAGQRHPLSAR